MVKISPFFVFEQRRVNPIFGVPGPWGEGGGVPAAHNSKTIHGFEMEFGLVE